MTVRNFLLKELEKRAARALSFSAPEPKTHAHKFPYISTLESHDGIPQD
jgi:hypothetical protein